MSLSDSAAQMERNSSVPARRRLPIGAECSSVAGGPTCESGLRRRRASKSSSRARPRRCLQREADGYCAGFVEASPGDRYQFRLDDPDRLYPDPASRFQPEGPHGPSEIVDPGAFDWTDARWRGATLPGQVIYELHVGTFTREGTWAAAARAAAGAGAPRHHADRGDAGRRVRRPLRLGLRRRRPVRAVASVRHARRLPPVRRRSASRRASPSSSTSSTTTSARSATTCARSRRRTSPTATTTSGATRSISTATDAGAGPRVLRRKRRLLDRRVSPRRPAARRDAADLRRSPEHVLRRSAPRARSGRAAASIVIVAENEPQDTRLVRPIDEGGYGLDALWNDDFHHSAMVALTGRAEAYYSDTRGEPQEFISAAKYGYLFQGQHYHWQRQPRGTPAWSLAPSAFVAFLQNHDQVANSARGLRGHQLTQPGPLARDDGAAAAGAVDADAVSGPGVRGVVRRSCTSPTSTPSSPPPSARAAANSWRSFRSMSITCATAAPSTIPATRATFERCKLDFARARHSRTDAYALHLDLLRLRREDRASSAPAAGGVDGACCRDRRSCCASSRTITDDRRADREPGRRPARGVVRRAAARAAASATGDSLVERGSAVRRRRHARTVAGRLVADSRRVSAIVLAPGPRARSPTSVRSGGRA